MTRERLPSDKDRNPRGLTAAAAILCALLFTAMMVFFSIFIIGTQRSRIIEDNLPIDTLLILKNTGAVTDGGDSLSYILPEFIGITLSNDRGSVGLVGGEELTKQLFLSLSEYVKYVFGSSFKCETAFGTLGDSLWRDACSEKNSVYIKFRGGLPDYIVKGFFDSGSDTVSGDMLMIKELFFIFNSLGDSQYSLRAVARSESGEVATYNYNYRLAGSNKSFTLDRLAAFIKIENFVGYDYYLNTASGGELNCLSPSAVIYKKNVSLPSVIISKPERADLDTDAILNVLGYNTDKLNVYSEYNGAENYIESYGVLRVSDDGELNFTASDGGGIPISDYLYYGSFGGNYTSAEKLTAVCAALTAIQSSNPVFYGGDAHQVIASITEGDELTIKYSYVVGGITIHNGSEISEACVVRIKGNVITYISIKPLNAALSERKSVNFPQLWHMNIVADNTGALVRDINLAYICDGIGEFDCQWVITADAESNTEDGSSGEAVAYEEIPR